MHRTTIPSAALVLILSCLLGACGDKGPAQKTGEAVDKAAEKTEEGVKNGAEKTGEAVEKAGEKVKDSAK